MTANPQGPVRVVPERTIGPVDLDRLRSIIHSATHHVLPFAEVPMMRPFSAQERAGMQVEIADRIIADIGQAAAPSPAAPEGVEGWRDTILGLIYESLDQESDGSTGRDGEFYRYIDISSWDAGELADKIIAALSPVPLADGGR